MKPMASEKKTAVVCGSRLSKYFDLTAKALALAEKKINKKREKEAAAVIDMARRYFEDAKFFEAQGHLVNAFAAINYAHGWLDCGSRLGLFKVKDSNLFVVK